MKLSSPSFVLELPLKITQKDEKELLSRFESARHLYNATLGEVKRKIGLVRQSKQFRKAIRLPKNTKNLKINKERKELFKQSRDLYDFNEFYFHKYIGELRHKLVNNLDIQTTQKIATRAFQSGERILYGKAKKARFKGYNGINSVESKSNAAGIRWRDNKILWNKLELIPVINIKDQIVSHGLNHNVKYCRILRKIIGGKNYFYVQLVLEGKPFVKPKNKMGNGTVSFDLGPSTIAITSKDQDDFFSAELLQFCSELKSKEKEIRLLQREIDRQRRQNNPNNYKSNGQIKSGRLTWIKSRRQIQNQNNLKEIYRKLGCHRKSLQNNLVNKTIVKGNIFKTEKISKKWLQKLYGKSIGTMAPGIFVSELKRKAESAGGIFLEFPTITTKLSQTCFCGQIHKKKLSERVHNCNCGVISQRDLFSSYLALFVEKAENEENEEYIFHADQAERHWSSADKLLQAAWKKSLQSATSGIRPASFGSLKSLQRLSGSSAEDGRAEFESQNVVPSLRTGESLDENEVFPLEPMGIYSP